MDYKRYAIKSPYCGRNQKGDFICRCGECHEIPGETDDRYDYPPELVEKLWQPTDSCYIDLSGSHRKEDEKHGKD